MPVDFDHGSEDIKYLLGGIPSPTGARLRYHNNIRRIPKNPNMLWLLLLFLLFLLLIPSESLPRSGKTILEFLPSRSI